MPSRAAARRAPLITVIVPVRNEERFITATLAALLAQDYPADSLEVLVVDGRSTDATREAVQCVAAADARVRLLDNPRRWSSAARNRALEAGRGELFLLVDGHCALADRGYLTQVADAFERTGADCLGRPQPLEVEQPNAWQRAMAAARDSRLGHHPDSHIYSRQGGFVPASSVAVAYRRELLERLHGFDESFDACEDVEFNTRVDRSGATCYLEPSLALTYHPRATPAGAWRQLARYGRGRARLARKHPGTLSWGTLIPALFVAGLIAGPLVSLLFPPLLWIYLGALSCYALLIGAATLAALPRVARDPAALLLTPLAFLTIHLAAGWGFLAEVVSWSWRNPFRA